MRFSILAAAALLAGCADCPCDCPCSCPCASPKEAAPKAGDGTQSLFDGRSLGDWKPTEYGGEGKVTVQDGEIRIAEGATLSGISWNGAPLSKTNYELSLEAKKVDGNDFFCGIIFPVGQDFCSFVAGGWGGTTVGLSSVDGMNASENDTSKYIEFPKGKWFAFRLRVTPAKIEAWIDKDKVVDLELKDRKISVHPAVELGEPLGIATYTTSSAFRTLKLKRLP